MVATFVNASSAANNTAATTGAVAAPASIAVGDVLILGVGYGSGATLTTLSGWTQLGTTTTDSSTIKSGIYWKVVVAGDVGATFTWTFTGTTTTSVFVIGAWRGVTATPIDASNVSTNTTTSQNVTTPTVTSVSSSNILVYIREVKDDTGTASNAECTPALNNRATNAITVGTTVAHGFTIWDNGPASVGSGANAGLATVAGTTTPTAGFAWTISVANSASAAVLPPPSTFVEQQAWMTSTW